MIYYLDFARALLNPLRGPRSGIQQGGSEAFICKAFKGKAIVAYVGPLITQQIESLRLARRVKSNAIKWFSSIISNQYFVLLLWLA